MKYAVLYSILTVLGWLWAIVVWEGYGWISLALATLLTVPAAIYAIRRENRAAPVRNRVRSRVENHVK